MNLMLYNSLTRQKERFKPIAQQKVKIYSCGPTVYNTPHIGNYRSFLFSDLLHRFYKAFDYQVTLVMNITDIDNKTIAGAKKAQLPLSAYTQHYEQEFLADLKTLNFLPATTYPRASEHIPEIVTMIETLLKKGHAYEDSGSIYFKLASFRDYGKLSGIDVENQLAGASNRIEADEYSRDTISDFALWKMHKPAEDGNVFYETTIGKGRPGWHIECSAMSQKYLGTHFDIHTGGIDNKFPHHENEIAQSVCATGKPFVNYWLHAAHLMIEGQKMSKSLNNIYTLRDLLKNNAHPLAIRYMLLSTHYRHTYNFTFANIEASYKALSRLARTYKYLEAQLKTQLRSATSNHSGKSTSPHEDHHSLLSTIEEKYRAFITHLEDDLNTSGALGDLFDLTHILTKTFNITDQPHFTPPTQPVLPQAIVTAALNFYRKADFIFGLNLKQLSSETAKKPLNHSNIPKDIEDLVTERNTLRRQKAFSKADFVRKKLLSLGYQLIDTQEKTIVQKITSQSKE